MRALKILLFITALASFVSCSKEEDDPQTDTKMLLGEWNLEEFSYSGINKYRDGMGTTVSYTGEAVDIDMKTVLLADGTYKTFGGYSVILTSTAEGETYVQNFTYSDMTTTGNWSVNGNIFTTTFDDDFQGQEAIAEITEGVIKELTANRLVLVYEHNGVSEVWGTEVEMDIDLIQVFSR